MGAECVFEHDDGCIGFVASVKLYEVDHEDFDNAVYIVRMAAYRENPSGVMNPVNERQDVYTGFTRLGDALRSAIAQFDIFLKTSYYDAYGRPLGATGDCIAQKIVRDVGIGQVFISGDNVPRVYMVVDRERDGRVEVQIIGQPMADGTSGRFTTLSADTAVDMILDGSPVAKGR